MTGTPATRARGRSGRQARVSHASGAVAKRTSGSTTNSSPSAVMRTSERSVTSRRQSSPSQSPSTTSSTKRRSGSYAAGASTTSVTRDPGPRPARRESRAPYHPAGVHVLFLTHYFHPEVGAPQSRILELAYELSDRAHEITVLTGFPNYPDGVIQPP